MNLDELQSEVERLLSLLRDRQPGLFSWNDYLRSRLSTIRKMIEDAGVK